MSNAVCFIACGTSSTAVLRSALKRIGNAPTMLCETGGYTDRTVHVQSLSFLSMFHYQGFRVG